MIRKIANYPVREDEIEIVIEAVKEFVAAINENEPGTVYTAYRLGNGASFIHFMAFPGEGEEERHRTAEYTKKFTEILYPLCVAPPEFTDLDLLGSTHIWAK